MAAPDGGRGPLGSLKIPMKRGDIDECFAKDAIDLARQARAAGNHPFGALLVLDGNVVLTALNTVGTDHDPTAHAESNLVAEAIRHLAPDQIRRSVLYTNCEPCAMCVGKMYWAGIRSLVYALPAEELALRPDGACSEVKTELHANRGLDRG